MLITDINLGNEYFFRVRSLNDKGHSLNWTPIKSVRLGVKPSAPTTWSNTSSAIIGEDLNLYWSHNSMDNSIERYARLHITVIDSAHPEAEPMEFTKVIENTKPEEEKIQIVFIQLTQMIQIGLYFKMDLLLNGKYKLQV